MNMYTSQYIFKWTTNKQNFLKDIRFDFPVDSLNFDQGTGIEAKVFISDSSGKSFSKRDDNKCNKYFQVARE